MARRRKNNTDISIAPRNVSTQVVDMNAPAETEDIFANVSLPLPTDVEDVPENPPTDWQAGKTAQEEIIDQPKMKSDLEELILARTKITELEKECFSLKTQNGMCKKKIADLTEKLELEQKKLAVAEKENDKLKASKNEIAAKLDDALKETKLEDSGSSEEIIAQMQEQIAALQNKIQIMSSENSYLTALVAERQQQQPAPVPSPELAPEIKGVQQQHITAPSQTSQRNANPQRRRVVYPKLPSNNGYGQW